MTNVLSMMIFRTGAIICSRIVLFLAVVSVAHAQLVVTESPLKMSGQKIVVPLTITNGYREKIESARASVFVSDGTGKLIGQGTRWVIGGDAKHKGLAPGETNTFDFVITVNKPIATTNLTSKVILNRVLLENGKAVFPSEGMHQGQ